MPRVTGPIRWPGPVEVRDVEFLRANTDRRIKITLPGPFTMAQQVVDEHYQDLEAMTMAFAPTKRVTTAAVRPPCVLIAGGWPF